MIDLSEWYNLLSPEHNAGLFLFTPPSCNCCLQSLQEWHELLCSYTGNALLTGWVADVRQLRRTGGSWAPSHALLSNVGMCIAWGCGCSKIDSLYICFFSLRLHLWFLLFPNLLSISSLVNTSFFFLPRPGVPFQHPIQNGQSKLFLFHVPPCYLPGFKFWFLKIDSSQDLPHSPWWKTTQASQW